MIEYWRFKNGFQISLCQVSFACFIKQLKYHWKYKNNKRENTPFRSSQTKKSSLFIDVMMIRFAHLHSTCSGFDPFTANAIPSANPEKGKEPCSSFPSSSFLSLFFFLSLWFFDDDVSSPYSISSLKTVNIRDDMIGKSLRMFFLKAGLEIKCVLALGGSIALKLSLSQSISSSVTVKIKLDIQKDEKKNKRWNRRKGVCVINTNQEKRHKGQNKIKNKPKQKKKEKKRKQNKKNKK